MLEICAAHGIPACEMDLSRTQFHTADEMFCTGTTGELAAVVELDGRSIGDGQPGPMTARLSELFKAFVAAHGDEILVD